MLVGVEGEEQLSDYEASSSFKQYLFTYEQLCPSLLSLSAPFLLFYFNWRTIQEIGKKLCVQYNKNDCFST